LLLLRLLSTGARCLVVWSIGSEVCAQIINQCVVIICIDDRAPANHLVDFFCPTLFIEPLLHNDAALVTLSTGGDRFGLHRTGREVGRRGGFSREQRRGTEGY